MGIVSGLLPLEANPGTGCERESLMEEARGCRPVTRTDRGWDGEKWERLVQLSWFCELVDRPALIKI